MMFDLLVLVIDIALGSYCDYYLAPSTVPGAGRGIIAGKPFALDEVVELSVPIPLKRRDIHDCQLENYVFDYDGVYSTVAFGNAMMYNHGFPFNVLHHWYLNEREYLDPSDMNLPFTSTEYIEFRANEPIPVGGEIFTNYGHDWFKGRDLTDNDETATQDKQPSIISLEELDRYGHCLSNVYIDDSRIHFAGKGLFARKPFKKGEIVVISPVLTLPKHVVYATEESSMFANYCMAVPNSEVVLFPTNNAALMNHEPTGTANVVYGWYDWSSIPKEGSYYEHIQGNTLSLSEKLSLSPEELFSAPFSQLDLAFRAVRDIEEGEELTYDYGDSWVQEWNWFVSDLEAWEVHQRQSGEVTVDDNGLLHDLDFNTLPQFRSYIGVRSDLFPAHWLHSS